MSDSVAVVQGYIDAWNAHDGEALVETFVDGGTYEDPVSGKLDRSQVADYARGLWAGFPDLRFEARGLSEYGPEGAVLEWLMLGTNSGSFQGLPQTGLQVSVPGCDVIRTEGGRIRSVRGYFDSRDVPAQLGLDVLVQPRQAGPFEFGGAVAASGGRNVTPGAFSITTIWNDETLNDEVREHSRNTAMEMLGMEGFIGVLLSRVGKRGITVSAWETPEHPAQLLRGGAHGEAMRRFWDGLGDAAFTSVWVPARINAMWVRCPACKSMNDHGSSGGRCDCGARLPDPPAYF